MIKNLSHFHTLIFLVTGLIVLHQRILILLQCTCHERRFWFIEFENNYPDRFFDVGIAEQHSATLAAGLAIGGLKPIVYLFNISSMTYDQLIHDVIYKTLI